MLHLKKGKMGRREAASLMGTPLDETPRLVPSACSSRSAASRASFCELCRAEHATIGAEEAQFDTSDGSKRRGEAGTSAVAALVAAP